MPGVLRAWPAGGASTREASSTSEITPADVDLIVEQTDQARPASCRSCSTAIRRPGSASSSREDIPFYRKQMRLILGRNGLMDPTCLDDYIALGGYASAAQGADHDAAGGDHRGDQAVGPARSWGRRVPDRAEVGDLPEGRAVSPKYVICNADEGRSRRLHGPRGARGQPALGHRGHDDRRVRHRLAPGVRLRAQRVPAGGQEPRASPSTRRGSWGLLGERHPRDRASTSTST